MGSIVQLVEGSGGGGGGGGGGGLAAVLGALSGLGLSNDSTTPNSVIDVAAGAAADSTGAATITLGAFTKSTAGTWASGSGSQGLDAGTVANNTWYHVFAISKLAGVSPDVLISTSATTPTLPNGYSLSRRIGSFLTDGSAHIVAFTQFGSDFRWKVAVQDVSDITSGLNTGSTLTTLSVPTGVKVLANISSWLTNGSGKAGEVLFFSPDDTTPTVSNVNFDIPATLSGATGNVALSIRTNTSGQIGYQANTSTSAGFNIRTNGWTDFRGQQ